MDTATITKTQAVLKEWPYNWTPLNKGYTDKILYVNVGSVEIKEKSVSPIMKEKFIGGRGYGLRLLWDATKPDTDWRNHTIFRNRKIDLCLYFAIDGCPDR
jgi:aldehyde:ferredoxin oxidoreductase